MAQKKPNKKPMASKKAMRAATRLFAVGACAEIYLLTVYDCFVNGTISQVLAWSNVYLPILGWMGLAMVIAGLALMFAVKTDKPKVAAAARILIGAGVFLSVTTPLALTWYGTAIPVLCVIVPAVMILGLLWYLYDRECVYALTILCGALLMLWACRKGLDSRTWSLAVRAAAVVCIAVIVAVVLVLRKVQANGGMLKDVRIMPYKAAYLPVYAAAGISVVLVAAGMVGAVIAYYAMWAAAAAIFGMAVYYTVQQL